MSFKLEMPIIQLQGMVYPDPVAQFMETCTLVGGVCFLVESDEEINECIAALYPEVKTIASNLPQISMATLNPDHLMTPHQLAHVDLAVVEGALGVAENGCVALPQNVKHRALYFIAENLIILLDKNKIVSNMHQAYSSLELNDELGFTTFISGPSKTADIEQALVVGAHGAKAVTVILY